MYGDNVTLSSVHFLGAVETGKTNVCNNFHRLTVDDAGGRFRISSRMHAHALSQSRIDPLKHTILMPEHEVAVRRPPMGKIVRQHAPLASGAGNVENGIHDLPPLILGRPATFGMITLDGGDKVGDEAPLFLSEV